MRKRHKKEKVGLDRPAEVVIVEERKEFGYIISESLTREQRGKLRGILELLGEKGGA